MFSIEIWFQNIYFNDARVISGDNPALNGLIHIIDKARLGRQKSSALLTYSIIKLYCIVFAEFLNGIAGDIERFTYERRIVVCCFLSTLVLYFENVLYTIVPVKCF